MDKCAAAFVEGIEARKERVYCPRWVALFRWLKPVLSTPVGEFPVRRTAGALMTQMDAEVAALGRSTSAYTEEIHKTRARSPMSGCLQHALAHQEPTPE